MRNVQLFRVAVVALLAVLSLMGGLSLPVLFVAVPINIVCLEGSSDEMGLPDGEAESSLRISEARR